MAKQRAARPYEKQPQKYEIMPYTTGYKNFPKVPVLFMSAIELKGENKTYKIYANGSLDEISPKQNPNQENITTYPIVPQKRSEPDSVTTVPQSKRNKMIWQRIVSTPLPPVDFIIRPRNSLSELCKKIKQYFPSKKISGCKFAFSKKREQTRKAIKTALLNLSKNTHHQS